MGRFAVWRLAVIRRHVARFLEAWVSESKPVTNGRFLLAVSGGPDSLAMLHAVHSLFSPDRLAIAHLDHGLLPDSRADAVFVQETADLYQIPCFSRRVDVAALAQINHWSIEEAGREARYRFLAEVAQAEGITAVLAGHNANDQAETILLNLLRGSGMRGLRGMAATSRLVHAPDVWLLRPLLNVERAEIVAYCEKHQLSPRIDVSNNETIYTRNRIRQELVPLLQTYNPQVEQHLQQTAVLLAADDDYLNALTDTAWPDVAFEGVAGWLCLRRVHWKEQPLALRRRLLRRAIIQVASAGAEIGFRTLEAARRLAEEGETGSKVNLPADVSLHVAYDNLWIGVGERDAQNAGVPQLTAVSPQFLTVPGTLMLAGGWVLQAARLDAQTTSDIYRNDDVWQAFVDVGEPLFVRGRRAGERIQPLGMNGRSAKLKDVMINRKLPAVSRVFWPIVATEKHPVWLVGHCLDERVRVTAVHPDIIHLRCWQLQS